MRSKKFECKIIKMKRAEYRVDFPLSCLLFDVGFYSPEISSLKKTNQSGGPANHL